MYHLMAKFWWILAVRGILGILLSLLALGFLIGILLQPNDLFGLSLFSQMTSLVTCLILLLGLYAWMDGIFSILLGIQDYGEGRHWMILILEGFISVALGVLTWLSPLQAVMSLLFWIALWAFTTGVLEVQEGFDLNEYKERRPLFFLAGICSILFSVLIVWVRVNGLELVELIGAYAFIFGVLLLVFAFRLRHYTKIYTVD